MEDIEGISEEEFKYLIANPQELNLFMQIESNRELLTPQQYAQAVDILQ